MQLINALVISHNTKAPHAISEFSSEF